MTELLPFEDPMSGVLRFMRYADQQLSIDARNPRVAAGTSFRFPPESEPIRFGRCEPNAAGSHSMRRSSTRSAHLRAHDACHCILRNRPSRGLYAWRLKRVKYPYGICALGLYNHTKLKRDHTKNTARYVQPTHSTARALIRCEDDVLGKSPGKTPLSSAVAHFSPSRFT